MNIYDQLKQLFKRMDDADKKIAEAVELPEVSSADNGDVLTVVNGVWAKAANSSQLPAVSGADNDKVLTVVNGQWAPALPTGSGLHYSTNEIDTFDTWIDGRPIYQKTFTGRFSNSRMTVDVSAIGIDAVVNIEGVYTDGTSFYGANEAVTSSVYNYAHVAMIADVLKLDCYCNISGVNTAYVTIYYTKTNETKKATKRKATK